MENMSQNGMYGTQDTMYEFFHIVIILEMLTAELFCLTWLTCRWCRQSILIWSVPQKPEDICSEITYRYNGMVRMGRILMVANWNLKKILEMNPFIFSYRIIKNLRENM